MQFLTKSLTIAMRHLSVTFHGEDFIIHSSGVHDGWGASFPCSRSEGKERERSKAGEEQEGEPFTAEQCTLRWAQSLHPRVRADSRGVSPSLQSEAFPGSTSPHHSPLLPTHEPSRRVVTADTWTRASGPEPKCLGLIVLQLPHPPPS